MRILAFTPTNPNEPYIWPRTVTSTHRAIKAFQGGPVDWVIGYHDNPYPDGYDNITHNYNRAVRMALDGGYDALLTIECDMVIPVDAIDGLMACDSDIAYSLYVWRHGMRNWSAYTEVAEMYGRTLSDEPDAARAAWGTIIDVAGVGLGCTLIRRDALRHLNLRHSQYAACDWYLAVDAQAAGLTQRANLAIVCGHCTYKPWPQIIWPSLDKHLHAIEPIDGTVKMEPGQTYTYHVGMGNYTLYAEEVTP